MSEQGFFHTSIGYWQTTDEPPEDILAAYPEGTYRVPLKPGENFEWIGGKWEEVPEPDAGVVYRALDPTSLIMGLLYLNITPDMVDGAIATMPEPDRTIAKWRWERSQVFSRNDWLIEEMATVFGKTVEEVDAAWLYAQSL